MGETDDEVDEFAEAVAWFGELDGSWPEASSPPASWCSWEPSLMGSLVGDFSLLGCVCSSSVSIGVPVYQCHNSCFCEFRNFVIVSYK